MNWDFIQGLLLGIVITIICYFPSKKSVDNYQEIELDIYQTHNYKPKYLNCSDGTNSNSPPIKGLDKTKKEKL